MIIYDKPTGYVAVYCDSVEEWKQVWKILMDSGDKDAPRLSLNLYSKGENDHIRITIHSNSGEDCGFCDNKYYVAGGFTIIGFNEFLEKYVRPKYAIDTPTLAKKVMIQQALFDLGWLWYTGDTTISKSMGFLYIMLDTIERTFSQGNKEMISIYTVITTEEFLSNTEKYLIFPNSVVGNK